MEVPIYPCTLKLIQGSSSRSAPEGYSWKSSQLLRWTLLQICCCSFAKLCLSTLHDPMNCSTLHCLPEFAQSHVHWVSHAIQPSHPLLFPSPPAFNLSQHQSLFQQVGSLHQVIKDWSFGFSISPSNEYSGLISFRLDWFDLLAVQGILKSLI